MSGTSEHLERHFQKKKKILGISNTNTGCGKKGRIKCIYNTIVRIKKKKKSLHETNLAPDLFLLLLGPLTY